MTDAPLLDSLRSDLIVSAMRDADRIATLAVFGQEDRLDEPDSVRFSAGSVEIMAARLAQTGSDAAVEACRDAFDLLRGVVQDPAPTTTDTVVASSRLLLRAASFGVLADLPSQTRQLLSDNGHALTVSGERTWGERVQLTAIAVWLRLIRKLGWDDLDQARGLLEALRADQEENERWFLETADEGRSAAWTLVASYHLLRAAEIVTEYTETGSVGGLFDPVEQAQMHFDRAREAGDHAADGELVFVATLLELVAGRLVSNSIWNVARGAGTRTQRFVQELTSRARPRPILELLPPQRRALVDAGLVGTGRRSVVVSLPTSAGKTLIAEFRILQALDRYEAQQGWVAYTAPTRALVNQLTSRLRRDLAPLGIRVERFSPALEVDSVEAEILDSDSGPPFRVVVTTPEKLDLLLRGGWTTELGRPITLVIIDEAHNLAEGARGIRLELLLATVNREHRDASFLLLTPFVPNAQEISTWLDPTNSQAVELGLEWLPNDRVIGLVKREHGLHRGDTVILAETVVASTDSLQADQPIELASGRPLGKTYSNLKAPGYLAAAASSALGSRGSTVTLVQQPGHSWSLANALAEYSSEPTTRDEIVESVQTVLKHEYGTHYPLVQLLDRRVAVHHAGLSDDVRGMLEALAERGSLSHIVATTTLAQGINFPISNVVLASHQYPYGVDMPPEDFWNIAGRAGRADHGQPGVVLLSAPDQDREATLREYVGRATRDLNSQLLVMVADAIERHGHLDLARLTFQGEWSAFAQFITHTYRVVGAEVFAAQVEQVLRGTLGYRTLRSSNPAWADALVQSVLRYAEDLAGHPISLVDSTGFSWQSVNATLAQLSNIGIGDRPWGDELFAPGSDTLKDAIGILLHVPELREQLVDRLDTAEAEGDFLARVVKDWVAGRSLAELAESYFTTAQDGRERDATRALTRCCQRLFGSILPTVSWGLSALQALNLARATEDVSPQTADIASFVYYGVNTREAVAMRLFGVPRGAAGAVAQTLSGGRTANEMRAALDASTADTWRSALGDIGVAYFNTWRLVDFAA